MSNKDNKLTFVTIIYCPSLIERFYLIFKNVIWSGFKFSRDVKTSLKIQTNTIFID